MQTGKYCNFAHLYSTTDATVAIVVSPQQYQWLGRLCCILKMEPDSKKMLECWYIPSRIHGGASWKTIIFSCMLCFCLNPSRVPLNSRKHFLACVAKKGGVMSGAVTQSLLLQCPHPAYSKDLESPADHRIFKRTSVSCFFLWRNHILSTAS